MILAQQLFGVGADTALAQIIRMVEEAQASSAPIQRIADEATRYFVPAVVATAFLAFAGWWLAGNFPQGLMAFIGGGHMQTLSGWLKCGTRHFNCRFGRRRRNRYARK